MHDGRATRDGRSRWRILFWLVLGGVTGFRAWLASALPLTGDEAYHWEWSRHLALGYYDHPGLVAYAIALATRLCGETSELSVRLPAIAAMAVVAWSTRRLALRLGPSLGPTGLAAERAAAWAGLLALAVPVFAFFGLYISGDPLLFAAWALAMDLGWRAATEGRWRAWLGLGLAAGAGMQAKFLFLPFLPAFALFLLGVPARRSWLLRPQPWVALALALAVNAPFLWWNAEHGWPTFRFNFLLRRDTLESGLAFLELAASQALVLTPVVFGLAVLAAARILRRWRSAREAELYLALLFAIPLAGHAAQSLAGTQIGAHWPAAGALSALVLLPALVERARPAAERRARLALLGTLGLAAALTTLGHAALLLPPWWAPSLVLTNPAREQSFHSGRLAELHGWRELGARVDELRRQSPDRAPFLLAAQYGFAAQLSFYTPGRPHALLWEPPRRHGQSYRTWDRFEPLAGEDALFVTKKEERVAPGVAELEQHFRRTHAVETLAIRRAGREVRRFFLVRCEGYDGVPPSFP